MLTIRQAQMDAFLAAMNESRANRDLAPDLIALGHADLANPTHLALIGGDPGDEPRKRLSRFARRLRAEARADGITAPLLVLAYAALPFRFGGDWRGDPAVQAVLADPELDERKRMQRINDHLANR
ncbi:MAG TPA: hypothetical protein VEU30_06115 [Thermoanaerobaculia bacterium]|nr:hypothetical protein [Thermoanaerobaculia bacterium]